MDVAERLDEYVETTDIPILSEFAYKNNLTREYLYTLSKTDEALFNAIKKCTQKKEAVLEKGALKGKLNSTMAIFSLKQLGWKDKQDEKDTSAIDVLSNILSEMRNTANDSVKSEAE